MSTFSKIKIVSKDGISRIFVDGVDITERCTSFELKQEAGEYPMFCVTHTYFADELDVTTEAENA